MAHSWRFSDEEMSAIAAARDEAARLGYSRLDDRILITYRDLMEAAWREQIARDIEAYNATMQLGDDVFQDEGKSYLDKAAAIARGVGSDVVAEWADGGGA